jgi:hypothetical protein
MRGLGDPTHQLWAAGLAAFLRWFWLIDLLKPMRGRRMKNLTELTQLRNPVLFSGILLTFGKDNRLTLVLVTIYHSRLK